MAQRIRLRRPDFRHIRPYDACSVCALTKKTVTPDDWTEVSRYAGPDASPGFLLWLVSTTWRRQVEAALAPLGLTHPQFVTMASVAWLTREGEPVSQAALGRHVRLDPNTMSQILRGLEKRGLIERRKGRDTRAKNPRLTDDGEALVRDAVPLVEEVDGRFFKPMRGGQSMMAASLSRLLEVAEGRSEDWPEASGG
jgi:DNA-binding MarR family transcriptional regulator